MEILIYIIIGVAAGFAVAWFWAKQSGAKAETDLLKSFDEEKTKINTENAMLKQQQAVAESKLESERQHAAQQLEQQQKAFDEKLSAEQEYSRQRLEQQQKAFDEKLHTMREHAKTRLEELQKQHEANTQFVQEEIKNMTAQMLSDSKTALNKENQERLDVLLTPLRERMEAFQKAVSDSNKENVQSKTEIKTAFEDAMKKLHDEQERTVKELKEQTTRISDNADSLTRALKGDSKMQGDWGEMILDKTLEDSGLTKDEQYFLQPNYKDADGNNFRPDAVIEFPNHETAVVDSKVSLTAYQEAVKAENSDDRDRWLQAHVASVKAHVNELADKNYERLVPGCIGYVLMFIPYESGYSAAVKTDASILQYAYKKHIIILSPSNLLMALQLTHTMWQNYRMNKNVEEILRQSNDLYDKFVTFAETFIKIDADIQRMQKDFDQARNQLQTGKGNIIRRLDSMKSLGITPKKQIPDQLTQIEG